MAARLTAPGRGPTHRIRIGSGPVAGETGPMRLRSLPRFLLLRVLPAAALGLAAAVPARAAEPVYPAGSRFGFAPPADMSPSRRFSGFERKEGGATLSVVELPPAAFADLVQTFTDANLKSQGFAVETREPVKIGEAEGMLFTGEQPGEAGSGQPAIRKWLLLVGDPTVTGLIIGQALPDAETGTTMRALVTGVTIRSALSLAEQVEALPFRIADPAGFRPVRVLAQAVQQPPPAEQRDGFAKAALYANQTMKDFVIERAQSYRSNGTDWHEIVARATDLPTNTPVVVSQTIRFAPDGYLRALGVVREDQREGTLAKFREVVDSVQVK